MIFFSQIKETHDHAGGFLMSRKCGHDWFDHPMMYSLMSNKSGGSNIGCGPILTLIGLGLMVFSILNFIAEIAA